MWFSDAIELLAAAASKCGSENLVHHQGMQVLIQKAAAREILVTKNPYWSLQQRQLDESCNQGEGKRSCLRQKHTKQAQPEASSMQNKSQVCFQKDNYILKASLSNLSKPCLFLAQNIQALIKC